MHKPANVLRHKYGYSRLTGTLWDEEKNGLPFALHLDHKVTPEEFGKILADHYEGFEDNTDFYGPGRSPHHSAEHRRICVASTIDAIVCEFSDEPMRTKLWTCPGRPCTLPYLPFHPAAGLPKVMINMPKPSQNTEEHYLPAPERMLYYPNVPQLFRDYQNFADMLYCDVMEKASENLAKINEMIRKNSAEAENKALEMAAAGDTKKALAYLCGEDNKSVLSALAQLQQHADMYFNIYEASAEAFMLNERTEEVCAEFTCGSMPKEESLVLGLGGQNIRSQYARAKEGSLKVLGNGRYSAVFGVAPFDRDLHTKGYYDMTLGGNEADGKAFAARLMLECK